MKPLRIGELIDGLNLGLAILARELIIQNRLDPAPLRQALTDQAAELSRIDRQNTAKTLELLVYYLDQLLGRPDSPTPGDHRPPLRLIPGGSSESLSDSD